MWRTLGHKNQKLFLENALKNRKYAHAYLFSGPEKIGKKTLAIEFANKILGTEDKTSFNADLIISGEDGYKVEDVRNLIANLSLKPYQYEYKVAILDNVENMTDEGANALLKTFEEASPTTVIILITRNKQQLLPTIVSRAQVLNFNRLEEEDLKTLPLEVKPLFESQETANLINGKLGKAFEFALDSKAMDEEIKQNKKLQSLKKDNQTQRLLAIKGFAEMETADLIKVFGNWLDYEHSKLVTETPSNYKTVENISASIDGLKKNLNKKMVLEKLFLNL